jgi:Flp pilus assembly protein TadD
MLEAERLLKEAFQENPRDERIQQTLVNLYLLTQRTDKARDVLEKWLKDNPQDQKAQQTLNRLNQNR